jgi:hypothetical protein
VIRFIKRNKLNTALLLCTVIPLSFLTCKQIINIIEFDGYSVISTNAIFGGFLYTGLGIVVSVLDKDIIKYLDKHGYMDGYINGIVIGLIFHIGSIIITFSVMLIKLDPNIIKWLEDISISIMLVGVTFFIKSVFNIMKLINIVRKDLAEK